MNTAAFAFTSNNAKPDKAEIISKDTFERLKRLNRIRRTRRFLFTVLFAAAACVIFAVGSISLFCRVKNIVVEGVLSYDAEAIKRASGIVTDENIYAIDKEAIGRAVIGNFPYVKDVSVRRRLPSTVALIIKEDEPRYYFELYGEYFVLSESLRVLERTSDAGELLVREPDIIKLNTREISYAVVGETLVFSDAEYFGYAQNMLDIFFNSHIADKITLVDFSDKFNIYIMYDNRFKIEFGNVENIGVKMDFAEEILKSFSDAETGTINVENNSGFVILGKY